MGMHDLPSRARAGTAVFLGAVLLVAACWIAAMAAAARQPWLGVQLGAEGDALRVERAVAAGPPSGSRLLAVQMPAGERFAVRAADLLEEPDMLPSYAAWAEFYRRQQVLAGMLRSPLLVLHYENAGISQATLQPARTRPLASLPPVFWFQLLVGAAGALVGAWVLGLRPADRGARCLALTGAGLLLAACTAAVYSTRELALPAALFAALSTANHVGTIMFGIGLVGIFFFHPRPLAAPRLFAAAAAAMAVWGLADLAWWLPGPDWAMRSLVLVQMLGATALGIVQWRRSRGQPVERAALRWVLLSFLVGCGLFVALIMCSTLLGWLPPVSQGYAFGFFLIMYVGLAAGVRRYRLFDLDRWSLRVLMWVLGLLGIVLVDALLILLRVGEVLSLAGSILLVAAVYFPLRQWLWARLSARVPAPFEVLAGRIVALALAREAQRPQLWRQFLDELYQPLRIEAAAQAQPGRPALLEQGLGLALPSRHGVPALTLWQRDKGRRLFSPRDAELASQFLSLVGMAVQAHDAHEQGARAERRRIAADLHDDLGSKLLTIAQSREAGEAAALAREAMDEMRLAVQGLMGGSAPADEVVADWRAEVVGRAEAAGVAVRWHAELAQGLALPPRLRTQATRLLREAVSNALRHSGATQLEIGIEADARGLRIEVQDNGRGLQAAAETAGGHGVAGMVRRAQELGGECRFRPGAHGGTVVAIGLPLGQEPLEVPA